MELLAGLLIGALILLLCVPLILIRGYVIQKLWLWFIVPTFGAHTLTIPQALGLSVVISLLVQSEYREDKETSAWQKMGATFLSPLLALFIGWIIKHWM